MNKKNAFTNKKNALAVLVLPIALAAAMPAVSAKTTQTVTDGKLARYAEMQKSHTVPAPTLWYDGVQQVTPQTYEPSDSLTVDGGWGLIWGDDGAQWHYTIATTTSNWYYTSATATLYDASHAEVVTFDIDLPATTVNAVQLLGPVTSTMFDADASNKEVIVYIHAAGSAANNYQGRYWTRVYHLDGTLALDYELYGFLLRDGDYSDDKMRLLLCDYDTVSVEDEDGTVTEEEYTLYKIYGAATADNPEPQLEHTFRIPSENTYYTEGASLNMYNLDGELYYIISQYAVPYTQGLDSNYEMIINEDNYYTLVTYDSEYNKVDSVAIPTTAADDAYCRMVSFGSLGFNDFSEGYFTDDGFAYVATVYDYLLSDDDYRYVFDVYDSQSNVVATICDNVYNTWNVLKSIDGYSDQMMFMQIIDDEQMVQTVDLPSCEPAVTIPAYIDDEMISTDLNRYPYGNSYQYVIKMSYATSDDDGNVIARLGWYNTDLSLDHFSEFNLGENGEYFRPLITDEALDPYLLNTSSDLELLFIAGVQRDDATSVDDVLFVAQEDGTILKTFSYDEDRGDLYTAYLLIDGLDTPELAVVYRNTESTTYSYYFEFFDLPFETFCSGGSGTASDPYLIASVPELLAVGDDLSAHYKLVADLDMSEYDGTWSPLQYFSGSFDGGNHSISNLVISGSDYYLGMFGYVYADVKIQDLTLINPTVTGTSSSGYISTVAAYCRYDTLSNVHVYGAAIDASASSIPTVGGLSAYASLYSYFTGCSFDGDIVSTTAYPVGGIVGTTRSSTGVNACATSGSITAASEIGGIVGELGSNSGGIANSHSSMTLSGNREIGGIVGYNSVRAALSHCYYTGDITGTTPSKWSGLLSLGGIEGYLEPSWWGSSSAVVSGAVFAGNIFGPDTVTSDASVHRIVGYSVENETDEDGEQWSDEKGIYDCLASTACTVLGSTVSSSDATSLEGADTEPADLTTATFEGIGYVFGEDETAPWKATDGMPVLYFEESAVALLLDYDALAVQAGDSVLLTATVYGADASTIVCSVADEQLATAAVTAIGDGYAVVTVTGIDTGVTTVTVSSGTLSLDCEVTVVDMTGYTAIDGATQSVDNTLTIASSAGMITAEGATTISLFAANGMRLAVVKGDTIDMRSLAGGLYIVVAKDDKGSTATAKMLVK